MTSGGDRRWCVGYADCREADREFGCSECIRIVHVGQPHFVEASKPTRLDWSPTTPSPLPSQPRQPIATRIASAFAVLVLAITFLVLAWSLWQALLVVSKPPVSVSDVSLSGQESRDGYRPPPPISLPSYGILVSGIPLVGPSGL